MGAIFIKSKNFKRVFRQSGWDQQEAGDEWFGRIMHKGHHVEFGGFKTEHEAALAIDKFIIDKQMNYNKLQILKPKLHG